MDENATKFDLFVKSNGKVKDRTLPSTHTCTAYDFFEITQSQTLIPQQCEIFGEPLLYMFYGRASFRLNTHGRSPESDAYLPVCIVFKPDTPIAHKRLSPFDTGAWTSGLFEKLVYHKIKKEDFELNNLDSVKCVVDLFFVNNDGYCSGRVNKDVKMEVTDFLASAYYNIITDSSGTSDNRRKTIELQTAQSIALKSESIEMVIIPDYWLNQERTKKKIDDAFPRHVRIEKYKYRDFDCNAYVIQINEILLKYFEQNQYIK